eukprot:m.77442 g.77442  ORF g.77442 m.77442 type:complete len:550 (+) comp11916_c0_seq1:28-1677(+)
MVVDDKGKAVRRADGKKKRKKRKKRGHTLQLAAHLPADVTTPSAPLDDKDVIIEYEPEELSEKELPSAEEFQSIFEAFKFKDPEEEAAEEEKKKKKENVTTSVDGDGIRNTTITSGGEREVKFTEEDDEDDDEDSDRLTKKQLRKKNRLTVAQLKQVVDRPDVVEMHDVNSPDPKTLVQLKGTRNSVPVPRHWCNKRKYLQGKRGIEKPAYQVPDFIKRTGIVEMRQAMDERDKAMGLKAKMRNKIRPKMGKLDLDYQKMHDAFFRWQTKPKMGVHGDIYYESKEFETAMPTRRPGELSRDLKEALGMPIESTGTPVPPPWLLNMHRFGPPPSYPNLNIPGVNAPLPKGASYGFHPGGWGQPPVDAKGVPLYGDVFGEHIQMADSADWDETIDKTLWGQIESESEDESEDESDDESDGSGDEEEDGMETPSGFISQTSGTTSMGLTTPETLDLRKRQTIEKEMENTTQQSLYKVIPQVESQSKKGDLLGSAHTYDVSSAVPGGTDSIDSTATSGIDSEALSGVDTEELEKSGGKRKRSQRTEKMKKFKF